MPMLHVIRRAAATAALALLPSLATAQHSMSHMENPQHEVGVDLIGFYQHQSIAGSSFNHVVVMTPVDLRAGFLSGDKLSVEARLVFQYDSKGGVDTLTLTPKASYVFTPDVNLLWGFQSNKHGPYFTAGAGVSLQNFGVSTSQFGFNGGLGTRVPYESGVIRLEAFTQYLLKNNGKNLPSALNIGARVGLSLWH
jgi:hypothetical protein